MDSIFFRQHTTTCSPDSNGSRALTQRDPSSVMFVLFVSSDSGQAYIFPVMTTNIIIYILKLRF